MADVPLLSASDAVRVQAAFDGVAAALRTLGSAALNLPTLPTLPGAVSRDD